MVAPAEAELFPQVLSVYDAAVRDGLWYLLDVAGPQVHRLDPATGFGAHVRPQRRGTG